MKINYFIKIDKYHSCPLDNYIVKENINGICVDIGSAIGEFPKKYHDKFKTILCFEPIRSNHDEGVDNNKHHDNVVFHQFAFSDKTGEIVKMVKGVNGTKYNFSILGDKQFKPRHPDTTEYQPASTINLDGILKMCDGHIDFLKMDCEGGEIHLIDDVLIDNVDYFSMEVHTQIFSPNQVQKLNEHLNKFFKVTKEGKIWSGTNKKIIN